MEQKPGSRIQLYYFDIPGRAEHIRYLFAVKGLKYEDVRVKGEQWPELKPKTPFGTMPVLEVDGEMVGQSLAAGRLAAKLSGLYGTDMIEQSVIDSYVEIINELRETAISVHYCKDEEEKEKKKKKFVEEQIPKVMEILSKVLGSMDFLVNNKLSWADVHFLAVCEVLYVLGYEQQLCTHECLVKLKERTGQQPGIMAYKKTQPELKVLE